MTHSGTRPQGTIAQVESGPAHSAFLDAARPDYNTLDDEGRYEQVEQCMVGTLTVANHLADGGYDTTVIPWIKGVTREERELSYRTIEQLGIDFAAFYANPYFNDGTGVRIAELITDLQTISKETADAVGSSDEPVDLCVLNCLSPNVVANMPPTVCAARGMWVGQNRGWRETVTPTKQSEGSVRDIFASVDQRVQSALGNDQAVEQAQTQPQAAAVKQEDQPAVEES